MDTKTIEGFSLLEVMLAVMMLSVGIVAVATMLASSMDHGAWARGTTLDTITAGGKLEHILSLPYHHDMLTDRDGIYQPESPDHGPFDGFKRGGSIEWEVCDNCAAPHTKRVTVTIRRQSREGLMERVRYNYLKVKGREP